MSGKGEPLDEVRLPERQIDETRIEDSGYNCECDTLCTLLDETQDMKREIFIKSVFEKNFLSLKAVEDLVKA